MGREAVMLDVPEMVRRGPVAGFRAGLRFLRSDGGYHAAALTYYLILALFPAGALIYALLGIFGAESAVDDAAEELAQRGFDRRYVNAVRETIESAVTQRSHEAWIVVAISVAAALYVASQWVRGVRRGLDAVLERPHASAGLGRQLRDALALVLLFSGAVLLQFGGSRIATGVFGEGFPLWQVAAYLLAAIAGACAYAYIYAFVAAPPRSSRDAIVAASVASMLLWIAVTIGFRIFAESWPGYDTNHGVFATLIVGLIWLWLTNVSVLLGGAFAHEWPNAASPVPARRSKVSAVSSRRPASGPPRPVSRCRLLEGAWHRSGHLWGCSSAADPKQRGRGAAPGDGRATRSATACSSTSRASSGHPERR